MVAGSSGDIGSVFTLARYNGNGSLDTSFDGDGRVSEDFGSYQAAAADVAVDANGRIVAAGYSGRYDSGWDFDFALARFNSDGSLDTSFDGDGKVTTDFGSTVDSGNAVALDADGKIVVVGTSERLSTGRDFALARYNDDGSLDTSFDGDGKTTTDVGASSDSAYGVAIDRDGKIVVAGYSNQGSSYTSDYDFALVRYDSDGTLDASFDGDGKVTTDFAHTTDLGYGVVLDADGRIVGRRQLRR